MSVKPLNSLAPGHTAIIKEFRDNARLQSRIVEMGILPGVKVRMIKKTPLNGPIEIKVNEFYLSLRRDLANKVYVNKR